jgi:enoyl-CoA hydratase/carnithine racemase
LFENLSPNVTEFKLNAPKNLNSLDFDMVHLMLKQVKQYHSNPHSAPRVLLMSGVGGKAFCAGGDIKLIYESGTGKADPAIKSSFFHDEYVLDYSLTQMKPLQISVWNGIVMGGGVGVSVHAPIRVATDNTVFAMPETGIGFFTDVGGSYFLPRVKQNINLGLYLGLTGHRLKAKELVQWGVATHYVPSAQMDALYADLKSKVT